jgi:hypothetical protein
MGWEDKRALVEAVFNEAMPDGRPSGVYVTPVPSKNGKRGGDYTYQLQGRLAWRGTTRQVGKKVVTLNATR